MIDIFEQKLIEDLPVEPFFVNDWLLTKQEDCTEYDNDNMHPHIFIDDFEYKNPNNEKEYVKYLKKIASGFHKKNPTALDYAAINSKKIDFYFAKKNQVYGRCNHRFSGPAKIHILEFRDYTHYEATWKKYNLNHRSNSLPAYYKYRINNTTHKKEIVEAKWQIKSRIHRIGGPAVIARNSRLYYYINNQPILQIPYWLKMIEMFPKKYRVDFRNDSKIILNTDYRVPAPSVIYLKVNKIIWEIGTVKVNAYEYWCNHELNKSNNFITI